MKPKKARRAHSKVGAAQSAKRVPLSLRVTPQLKALLDAASTTSGRSQTQEIEFRLEQSFERASALLELLVAAYGPQIAAVLAILGETLRMVAAHATARVVAAQSRESITTGDIYLAVASGYRRPQLSHPYVFAEAMGAIGYVLGCLRPSGDDNPPEGTGEPDYQKLAEMVIDNLKSPLKVDVDFAARVAELLGDLRLENHK